MATAADRIRCATCEEEKTISKCSGCLKVFCGNHLTKHRQQLKEQLNEIEDKRDLFRQTLDPQKHPFIQQIHQWKEDSIKKIEQVVDQARKLVLKHITEHIEKTETKLTKLNEELKEIGEENNLNEVNLNELKVKLQRLEEEFHKPSNISIHQNPTAFINKIIVQISSPKLDIAKISINTIWRQYGMTVAGGTGSGNSLHQLSSPYGFCIDNEQTIYVADQGNHRIIERKKDVLTCRIVAGGNGNGNETHQLKYPSKVIIDKENDSLIISDYGNQRVVRWARPNGTNGETIISKINCWGLAMDNDGYLYVSDTDKHEVRRWKIGETTGTLVAGGNGKGHCLNQLDNPRYIFVDQDHSVYVSDNGNHRVMKWIKDAKEGVVVAGGQGKGKSLKQLSYPLGIIVDQLGTVYIADSNNDRVMRWLKEATEGSVVIDGGGGRNIRKGGADQFDYPIDLLFDQHNNLYVLDHFNHRVQQFAVDFSSKP